MRVAVTGPESSGSKLVARVVAHALGVCSYDQWNGHGWAPNEAQGASEQHHVLHRSMPWNNKRKFRLEEADPTHVIILSRDRSASYLSRLRDDENYNRVEQDKWINEIKNLVQKLRIDGIPYYHFSYEALMLYGGSYLQELYRFLGIISAFVPSDLKDGNEKYYDFKRWL